MACVLCALHIYRHNTQRPRNCNTSIILQPFFNLGFFVWNIHGIDIVCRNISTWNKTLDYPGIHFWQFHICSFRQDIGICLTSLDGLGRGRIPLKQHHVGEIPSSETNFRVWDLIICWSWISSQWEWKDPSALHLWQLAADSTSNWEEGQKHQFTFIYSGAHSLSRHVLWSYKHINCNQNI